MDSFKNQQTGNSLYLESLHLVILAGSIDLGAVLDCRGFDRLGETILAHKGLEIQHQFEIFHVLANLYHASIV